MNRVRGSIQTLLLSAFSVLILALYYTSIGVASNILNLLSALILGVTSFIILKARGGWIFLLYAFGLTFALLSGALIELTGAYLIEIQEAAYLTGAAARNALLATFFLVTAYVSYKFFYRITPSRIPTIKTAETFATRLLLSLAFAAPLYIATALLIYGSPLFMNMDRFTYMTYIAPPGYKWLYGNIPLLGFVVALSSYKKIIRQNVSTIWLIISIATYIMAGEKFSGILILIFFFLLPFFLITTPKITTKHTILAAIILLALAFLVILNYTLIYGDPEKFIYRLALQGQMNYAIDQISHSAQPLRSITRHFLSFGSGEYDCGLPYLMYLVAPSSIVDLRLEYGATFTAPFPSNISYFFSHQLSPVFIAFASAFLGLITALLHKAITSLNIIFSGMTLKAFLLFYVAITMGQMDIVFSLKGAAHLLAITLYLLAAHKIPGKTI